MRDRNEIITSQIPREELAGLLDTMAPGQAQRVTAEIEVPIVPEEATPPPVPTISEHVQAKRKRASTANERPTGKAATKKQQGTTGDLQVVVRFAPSATGSQPALQLPTVVATPGRSARVTDAIRAMTPADLPAESSRVTGPHLPLSTASSRTTGSEPAVLLPAPSGLILQTDRRPLPRWAIVAVSAGLTLFLAMLVMLVA